MISKPFSKVQKAAERAFRKLLANEPEADRQYDAIPDSHGGRIISTDLARLLEARYRDTPSGQPRDLTPGWDLAWRYAQQRFAKELQDRKDRKFVRFMAGGWGAGKTHALEHAATVDLAWDGTLKDIVWARGMIDLAISAGWNVELAYVFRDMELALYGAVERSRKEGRGVPLRELPGNHCAVQRSIRRLIRRYGANSKVAILLVHNTGAADVKGSSLAFHDRELAPGGALHYTRNYERHFGEIAREIERLNPV